KYPTTPAPPPAASPLPPPLGDPMSDPMDDPMDPNLPPNEPPLDDPSDPEQAGVTSPVLPVDPTLESGQDRSGMSASDPDGSQMQRDDAAMSAVPTRGTDPDLGEPDPRQFP